MHYREVANQLAAYRAAVAAGEDVYPPHSPHDEIAQAQRAGQAEDALLEAVRDVALYEEAIRVLIQTVAECGPLRPTAKS